MAARGWGWTPAAGGGGAAAEAAAAAGSTPPPSSEWAPVGGCAATVSARCARNHLRSDGYLCYQNVELRS
jgi:hypothetical protein